MSTELNLSVQKSSESVVDPLKYEDYKEKCIKLLTSIITPCSKDSGNQPGSSGSNVSSSNVSSSNVSESTVSSHGAQPVKSSTFLQHNGKVGDLEELILFLIKSPTTNDIKFKLNKVYKIFNPEARDIIDNSSTISNASSIPVTPITPTPVTPTPI
jgi:hypothetical protein